ncbi:TolC family protein [Maribellus mangrovi]|uniref:TolC family protein n=1 Tax=Maribellus mangrovi TaxID=3133146 RepID=UPI0030EDEAD3
MKRLILLILILYPGVLLAQKDVPLDTCYIWARQNYPNLKQSAIWEQISTLNQENYKTTYYPQLSLNGQVSYQSKVTEIPAVIPGFTGPTVPKDQYKAYAELKQSIWDGGISSVNRELEDALLKSHLSELEIEIYKLYEQVAQAFFITKVIDQQKAVVEAQEKVLNEQLKSIRSGVENGMVEPSSELVIKAELLNLKQNKTQLEAAKNAARQMLEVLTGKTITPEMKLIYAGGELFYDAELHRPELKLYFNRANVLETQMEMLQKTRNPKLFGFGQLGYGKPGLNMLNDGFDSWYMLGLGVSWNAFDWKKTTRKKQVLQLKQESLQYSEDVFRLNTEVLQVQQKETIDKLKQMIETDEELIALRTEIAGAAESKLENQVITASDYISEVQAETVAKLNYELHKIQLDEAREKYYLIQGKVIK